MATFVSTTLARRAGGNTVFGPKVIEGGIGQLAESGDFESITPRITVSSRRTSGNRRVTRIRVAIPQVDNTNVNVPTVSRTAFADLTLTVPDGYPQSYVNDIVGFVEKLCATSVTNFNAILVNGEGVY